MGYKEGKGVEEGGFYGRYLPPGHVVYMHEGTLFAVPFDVNRLEGTGAPAPVLEGIGANPVDGAAHFTFSQTGNFAYVPGRSVAQNVSIYWMDRQGQFTPVPASPPGYVRPPLSPHG